MKKLFFLVAALSLILSACLPAQAPAATPAPTENLALTADVSVQQTLQALPTQTAMPTITPVIVTPAPTDTPTQASPPTETQNPVLLTLTATLGAGTPVGTSDTINQSVSSTTTPSATPNPAFGITSTGTAYPLHSGTMPPNLPFGELTLINKSKSEVYISLRCVTKDDFVTIIEYPVKGIVTTRALAGQYTYVTWVGGRKIIGSFSLGKSQELTLKIYKDRVEIN